MSQSTKTTGGSFAMSPHIAPSQSSNTTANQSSITPSEQAAIDRWMFNRARTDKEHAAFREKMQFQSADFHHFLYKTAKTSPKIAVPSPSWENIPFPVPAKSPIINEGNDVKNLEMNVSIDDIQDVPRRQPTPMDFGAQLQRPSGSDRQVQKPGFTFDRSSYDGAHSGNKDAVITVGAVFEVGHNSLEITRAPLQFQQGVNVNSSYTRAHNTATGFTFVHSDAEMASLGGEKHLEQEKKKQGSCMVKTFAWVSRHLAKLF